jgi:hypothetical protein
MDGLAIAVGQVDRRGGRAHAWILGLLPLWAMSANHDAYPHD